MRTRIRVVAMVASFLLVAGAVPTQARGEGTTESRQPAVVVMDFSGSMNKADATFGCGEVCRGHGVEFGSQGL